MALDTFNPNLFVSAGEQSNKFLTPMISPDGIASFQAQRAQDLTGLTVRIDPIQDLNGQANPYPAGGGKNKFPITMTTQTHNGTTFTVTDDGVITISGTPTALARVRLNNLVITPSSAMRFSMTGSATGVRVFATKTSSGTTSYPTITPSLTLSAGDTFKNFYLEVNTDFSGTVTVKMQLEDGMTETEWSPYSNICPISGRTGMTVATRGKNLFDKTAVTGSAWLSTTTGEAESASSEYVVSDYIPVKKGVSVYIPKTESARRWFYDVNKTPTTYLQNRFAQVFTPTADGYLRVTIYKVPVDIDTFQIEFGTSATGYEPYHGATYPITWETEAGTVYGGTLDVVSGVLTVDRAMATFDGSNDEKWEYYSISTGNMFRTSLAERMEQVIQNFPENYACNSYHVAAATTTSGRVSGTFSGSAKYVDFVDDRYSTLEDWRAALAQTPIQFVYPLATPQTYRLTPTDVKTLAGYNQIYSDAGPVIDIKF